jgi:hypothetical protein
LISTKQCKKVIAQIGKFVIFVVFSQSEKKIVAIVATSTQGPAKQQNQVEKVMEEYKDIFTSLIGVPLHFQVKHSIELIPGTPFPNGLVYKRSLLENEEIKCQIP